MAVKGQFVLLMPLGSVFAMGEWHPREFQDQVLPKQNGRVAIVTGGTRGMGFETARHLASLGMHVVIAGNEEEEGKAAVRKIEEEGEGSKGKAEFVYVDLTSMKSVRQFVQAFKNRGLPLHVLVNNAGTMLVPERMTEDGFEFHFALNYLGHFLLTNLLLDLLKRSGRHGSCSRIVNMSSATHYAGVVDLEDLNKSAGFQEMLNTCTEYGVKFDVKCNEDKRSVVLICKTKGDKDLNVPSFYPAGQALTFKKSSVQKLQIAYNDALRILLEEKTQKEETFLQGHQSGAARLHTMFTLLNVGNMLKGTKCYSSHGAYSQSKLALVLFTYYLQEQLTAGGFPVTVNAVDPGMVDTALYDNLWTLAQAMKKPVAKILFRTPAEGASISVYAAAAAEMEGVGSCYLYNGEKRESSDSSYDSELQVKLWKKSCELAGLP